MDTPSSEERVNEAIAVYLAEVDAGAVPDRQAFLARYPELASDLAAFLDDRERFARGAAPLGVAPIQTPEPASPGTVRTFGDYELLEEIARGGMGVVYKARQVSLNRVVALKMILAGQLASEEEVRRFRAEAEAAAGLEHPNIVPLYEVGLHAGQHYFSMKLIEGSSLADKVEELKADPKQVARLLAQVARAVHFAHQRGILHRDLKPANILLDEAGTPFVSDFGLARLLDGSRLTQSGIPVGTAAYMAPEQARAERLLTTTVDVYALGVILYELLTGKPPFQAATWMETLFQMAEQEPAAPVRLNAAADPDLSAVALKCLDKDPNRRYQSAAALAEELERWLGGESVQVRPAGHLRSRLRWLSRHPTMVIFVLFCVGFLASASGLVWMGGGFTFSQFMWRICGLGAAGLLLLLIMPGWMTFQLAAEERRTSRTPQPTVDELVTAYRQSLPPPLPVPQSVSELRRLTLKGQVRGAGEGLVVGGLLLIVHFVGLRVDLGRWPDPGLGWFCTFFFQVALMMALARGLGRLLLGVCCWPALLHLFWGLLIFWALSWGAHSMESIRYLLWVALASEGFWLGMMLVPLLVAPSADPLATWDDFKRRLSAGALFCPAIGFMLGELVAGKGQPAAFTAPLQGAMIGWAVGMVLVSLSGSRLLSQANSEPVPPPKP